ncbi:MAG: SAM-dependent methyltransferase [Rhodocyclaceae bacterium]|nr:SAM-dependent methyltransferase [Rhodocyclaceae bacterium]
MGTLYLLPAPLGQEALWPSVIPAATQAVACRLRHFIVENAKSARATLKWLGHPGPLTELSLTPLPARPTAQDCEHLLKPLAAGFDLGLLSDAGCPAVADPGALVVRAAHQQGHAVKPLVGPSSLLLALMASGLEGQRFAFHGYLPIREPARSQRIRELEAESRRNRQTQLFIEAPYRNQALFGTLLAVCAPHTWLSLATDLSQPRETICTRRIADWRIQARQAGSVDLLRRPTVFSLFSEE